MFAGVRPGVPSGEITKLEPEDINLETGMIHIRAEVSKVREPRRVAIQPNLAAWLRAYPLKKYPIVVGNFQKKRAKFKDQFDLTHDVLRPTFISMFVAKFRSIGEAAIQAGNSENIIRRLSPPVPRRMDVDADAGVHLWPPWPPIPAVAVHPGVVVKPRVAAWAVVDAVAESDVAIGDAAAQRKLQTHQGNGMEENFRDGFHGRLAGLALSTYSTRPTVPPVESAMMAKRLS